MVSATSESPQTGQVPLTHPCKSQLDLRLERILRGSSCLSRSTQLTIMLISSTNASMTFIPIVAYNTANNPPLRWSNQHQPTSRSVIDK